MPDPNYRKTPVNKRVTKNNEDDLDDHSTGKNDGNESSRDDNYKGKDTELDDNEAVEFDLFNNADDEKEQIEHIKEMNENACIFRVCTPIFDGERNYTVVGCPKFNWFEKALGHKATVEYSLTKKNRVIPDSIKNLKEHKLRVEYSPSNEVVQARGRNYPDTQWYTVIITSPIAHDDELLRELKRFTALYQRLNSPDTRPTPGRRFMNFVKNGGYESILNGLKRYMGEDENVIENNVNSDLIEMGKKPHRYLFNQSMDGFLPDYYIKKILEEHQHAVSWESVSENVKKICYKNYPAQQLPIWENIRI